MPPQAAAPPPPPPAGQDEIKRKPRIVSVLFLLGVILLICISLAVIVWAVGIADPWIETWFNTATPGPPPTLTPAP
jgi:hypothetical protein